MDSFKTGEEFGKNIRKIRKTRDLTLKEISDEAELSEAYLSDIERGKIKSPGLDVVKRLAEVLEVSIDKIANTKQTGETENSGEFIEGEELAFGSSNLGIDSDMVEKALEYPAVRLTIKVFADSSISQEVKAEFDRIIGSAFNLSKKN